MNRLEAFRILEIDVTDDKRAIKKAYAALVKKYHPEEYPEKWQEIHTAYETALKGIGTVQFSAGSSFDGNQDPSGTDTVTNEKGRQESLEEAVKRKNEKEEQEQKEQAGGIWEKETYRKEEQEKQERKEREGQDREEEEQREQARSIWVREEYRKEEQERRDSSEQNREEQTEKIGEEQEIDRIFDNIDELVQEKRAQEREVQEKKERKEVRRTRRSLWVNKLMKYIIYVMIAVILFVKYSEIVSEEREKTRTKEITELKIDSIGDWEKVSQEHNEWKYKEIYLPSLAYYYDEEKQKKELESGICLQEGIYLTSSYSQMAEESDVYTVREADVPEQFVSGLDIDGADCHVWSFCITSNKESEYKSLWCDLEKLGFGNKVKIWEYDEDQNEYVELELCGEDVIHVGQYSYKILDYRVFVIDTHVHQDEEMCEHPIVLISYD